MENSGVLNSYLNIPPSLLKKGLDWYEKPELWEGLKTGLIVAGLNHAAHLVQQILRKVTIEITDEITGSTTLRGYPYNSGDYEVPTYRMTVSGTDMWGDYDAADYDVVRFGIKDSGSGASVVGLAAGKYKVSAFYANKITSQGAFHIKGKYFIHVGSVNKQSNFDGNNGCIAILGRANYDRFKIQLFSLSGGSNIYQIARSGVVNININAVAFPPLKKIK